MRKLFPKGNRAVSPVIAIILMVAISVVLAAVLYTMLETDTDTADLLVGEMFVHSRNSSEDEIVLRMHLQRPRSVDMDIVSVDVLDPEGRQIDFHNESNHMDWTYLPGGDGLVRTDARLTIVVEGAGNYRNYEVILTFEGYPGTIERKIT